MEVKSMKILKISELAARARPLTGAHSLTPNRPISNPKPHSQSDQAPPQSTSGMPEPKILKPLNYPAIIVGTLKLPLLTDDYPARSCSCFQFSDDSATVCCDIIGFRPKMIGRVVKIFAWNFLPMRCQNGIGWCGFLEVIAWDFLEPSKDTVRASPCIDTFSLALNSYVGFKESSKDKNSVFGVIESVSPLSVVPCTKSADSGSDVGKVCGFLVNVLVCECKLCRIRSSVLAMHSLSEENCKDHCFVKPLVLYFCGAASSWHPVISRFIGVVITIWGLKKKLVYVGKEESQLMYLTTRNTLLNISRFYKKRILIHEGTMQGKGKCGSYVGVVTAVYMQGMVVELDQGVILLLTDQQLAVPHSLRIGAIVSIRNVHFVSQKYSWTKIFILGACFRTTIFVESFSPLETGCHLKSHSHSLLQKFVESLAFSARIWVLLLISCFRKKFSGILSEKEILGSKHKEGMAQRYASSRLPLLTFKFRHGVFMEFCKHDLCSVGNEAPCGHLKLVPPISNLISYCRASWMKMLHDLEKENVSIMDHQKPLSCHGRSYSQSIRRMLSSEGIGISVIGRLKVSSCGRLRLSDATGSIDIVPDFSSTWKNNEILEVENCTLVLEGISEKINDSDLLVDPPFSWRSIFLCAQSGLSIRMMKKSLSLFLYSRHQRSCDHKHLNSCDSLGSSQELLGGSFHLLMLSHIYPLQQRFLGDQAIANTLSTYAEAIILPWDLIVAEKDEDTHIVKNSLGRLRACMRSFSRNKYEGRHASKRCRINQASNDPPVFGLSHAETGSISDSNGSCSSSSDFNPEEKHYVVSSPLEFPCLITNQGPHHHRLGSLHSICADTKTCSVHKACKRRLLLEFNPDSFGVHEQMKIGGYYIVRHCEGDAPCTMKEGIEDNSANICINSDTHFWSVTILSLEELQSSDFSFMFPNPDSYVKNNEVMLEGSQQFGSATSPLNVTHHETRTDINLFVPADAQHLLEKDINISEDSPLGPAVSPEEVLEIHNHIGNSVTSSSQLSGTSYSGCVLPEGNLISLDGLVVALHDCNHDSFSVQLMHESHNYDHLPMSLCGSHSVCIHVLVDQQIVKIFGDRSKHSYPVGLGQNAKATFHRILQLSHQNEYMLIPASFITINYTTIANEQCRDESNYASGSQGLDSPASASSLPACLISEIMKLSSLDLMQLRCRVVAIYMLVLEKSSNSVSTQSSVRSTSSVIGIPLAGFVLDDGSSSCCCWADCERAATLLGLHGAESTTDTAETSTGPKTQVKQGQGSPTGYLKKLLKQHGRIIVKNYGSMFDSSGQDLTFAVDSNKFLSSSDEDLFRRLILNACLTRYWSVVGCLMDPNATRRLEERLIELEMTMLPLRNIWATDVYCVDPLAEARSILDPFLQ